MFAFLTRNFHLNSYLCLVNNLTYISSHVISKIIIRKSDFSSIRPPTKDLYDVDMKYFHFDFWVSFVFNYLSLKGNSISDAISCSPNSDFDLFRYNQRRNETLIISPLKTFGISKISLLLCLLLSWNLECYWVPVSVLLHINSSNVSEDKITRSRKDTNLRRSFSSKFNSIASIQCRRYEL